MPDVSTSVDRFFSKQLLSQKDLHVTIVMWRFDWKTHILVSFLELLRGIHPNNDNKLNLRRASEAGQLVLVF